MLVTWVFFRAPDVRHAFRYLGDMLALGTPQDSAGLLAGIVYQPYYIATFLAGRRDRVERAADVGLDADADAAEGGGRRGRVRRCRWPCWPRSPITRSSTSSSDGDARPASARRRTEPRSCALMEIAHTTVSAGTVRFLLTFFLVAIAAGAGRRSRCRPAYSGGGGVAIAFSRLSDCRQRAGRIDLRSRRSYGLWRRIVSGESHPAQRAERVRAGAGRRIVAGTSAAAAGAARDDRLAGRRQRAGLSRTRRWLFYRPDVEYLTGRRFSIARRWREGSAKRHSGPRRRSPTRTGRSSGSNDDLEARGIALIVMPTPSKPAIHPEKLAGRYDAATVVLQNPSFRAFVERLEREGVPRVQAIEIAR